MTPRIGVTCRKSNAHGKASILQFVSKKGDCWDNAVSENFFATIDREVLGDDSSWSPERSRLESFSYVETYCNRTRLHSTLGYLSPSEFEMESLGLVFALLTNLAS